jgi:hypothetical protein
VEGLRKTTNISIKVARVPTEIRAQNLSNTITKRHHYSSPPTLRVNIEEYLPGCDATYFDRSLPTFGKKVFCLDFHNPRTPFQNVRKSQPDCTASHLRK